MSKISKVRHTDVIKICVYDVTAEGYIYRRVVKMKVNDNTLYDSELVFFNQTVFKAFISN
ncbi:hypothetical protein ACFOEL_02250 [Virgibacillus litoralis]